MSGFLKRLDILLLSVLICGMAALTYSIFSSSYASERVTSPQTAPVQLATQSPREPYVSIANGISNDFSTDFGPWWLLEPVSRLEVVNPTNQITKIDLSLEINMAFCRTNRVVSITIQNTTKTVTLTDGDPIEIVRFRISLNPRSSTIGVLQTYSPVCQTELDPRFFLGELTVIDFRVVQGNNFNFSSQD